MADDYYKILGVSKTATADEIKKAYRKLAVQNHPDKHPEDKATYEKKFKEINEAYATLSDQQKRANYDQFGKAGANSGFGGGGSGFGGFGGFEGFNGFGGRGGSSSGFNFDDINDIFSSFFGGATGGQTHKRKFDTSGSDLKYNMEISLEDAFYCNPQYAEFSTLARCEKCGGSGSADGGKRETCKTCKGRGSVRGQQGFFIVEQECPDCQGTGEYIKNPCKYCAGDGTQKTRKKVKINIPNGLNDGDTIRVIGEGEAGMRGGTSGDLYVVFTIRKHKIFNKNGANLECTLPIRFAQATLGDEVEITGIDKKKILVKIPSGTQNGEQIVVKGEGMPNSSGRRGNLVLTIKIETPVKLSKEQQELLKKFDESCSAQTNPQSSGFFENLKKFFG